FRMPSNKIKRVRTVQPSGGDCDNCGEEFTTVILRLDGELVIYGVAILGALSSEEVKSSAPNLRHTAAKPGDHLAGKRRLFEALLPDDQTGIGSWHHRLL